MAIKLRDISKMVDKGIKQGLKLSTAVLRKVTYAARDDANPTLGKGKGTADHNTTGFYADRDHQAGPSGPGVPPGTSMRKERAATIILMGEKLTKAGVTPEPNDHIVLDGETWRIAKVKPDPANATYTCACKLA